MKKILILMIIGMFLISLGSTILWQSEVTDAHSQASAGTGANTLSLGVTIFAKEVRLNLTKVTKSAATTATIAYIINDSGTELGRATFVGNDATFTNITFAPNHSYQVEADKGGASYTRDSYGNGWIPLADTNINWTSGSVSGALEASNTYNIESITTKQELLTIIPLLISPANDTTSLIQTINFSGNLTSIYNVANVSLIINGKYNETNSSAINNTVVNFTKMLAFALYNWTYEACDLNDTCVNATTRTITIGQYKENSQTANASSFETASETFSINITTNGTAPTSATLWHGSSGNTGATITNTAGNNYNITKTIDIPTGIGAKSWFFDVNVGGFTLNSTTQSQLINVTNFTKCYVNPIYINISFRNETTAEENITSDITSTWYYWIGSGDVVKTYTFTNTSENLNYSFCTPGSNRTLNLNLSMTYNNGISQQRNYLDNALTLTNSSVTNLTLFLLPTADGQFVTFQVVNSAEQPISGVFSNVTRSGVLVGSGTTDDSGAIQYFLDPDTSYFFFFNKTGEGSFSTTLVPSQTSYTITLGGTASVGNETSSRGLSYTITPSQATLIANNTNVYFNFTLTSTFWTVSSFGFNLSNENGTVVNSTSAATNGGKVFVLHNTGANTNMSLVAWWIINGNLTIIDPYWVVLDNSGTGFGLNTFFTHLKEYTTDGIFGLTTNGMAIISFIIIFLIVGVFSFKYGLTAPGAIITLLWILVFFFENILGYIPNYNDFPLATTLMTLIAITYIVRENL